MGLLVIAPSEALHEPGGVTFGSASECIGRAAHNLIGNASYTGFYSAIHQMVRVACITASHQRPRTCVKVLAAHDAVQIALAATTSLVSDVVPEG